MINFLLHLKRFSGKNSLSVLSWVSSDVAHYSEHVDVSCPGLTGYKCSVQSTVNGKLLFAVA